MDGLAEPEVARPRDYTGTLSYSALYTNNAVMSRSEVLDFGGFDEDFETAEDNDLCYRWLRAGRRLRYEPRLTVWHHDWRTPEQMMGLYAAYGRGAAPRRGGRTARAEADAREARGVLRGLPGGLAAGLAPRGRRPPPRGEQAG